MLFRCQSCGPIVEESSARVLPRAPTLFPLTFSLLPRSPRTLAGITSSELSEARSTGTQRMYFRTPVLARALRRIVRVKRPSSG